MAIGLRLSGSPARVYAVLGDGEQDEGSVWEAADSAPKFALDNLCAVTDYNKVQLDGTTDEIMLFEQLYNAVDAVVVGQFVGTDALAAVGGSPAVILNLVIGFFAGLSSGATVVISQYYGAGDSDGISKSVHTAVAFCLAAGAALTVFGILITPWSLRIVHNPEDIMALAMRSFTEPAGLRYSSFARIFALSPSSFSMWVSSSSGVPPMS